MKLLNELLGFAVLTGPLWLVLILLPASIWIAFKIAKRFKRPGARFGGGVGIFLLVFCVPFADEIAGGIYFNYLCTTKAGVKVYQTVELPAEYWDEGGSARFIQQEGSLEFDESMLGNRYTRKSTLHSQSVFFRIDRDSYQLIDSQTQSILGEDVNFMYWGGWISRNFSPNISAIGCSRYQVGYFTDVLKQVFKQAKSN
jgi:hypothetical protein